jgi:hypothetical protein
LLWTAVQLDLAGATPYLRALAARFIEDAASVRRVEEALAARGLPALPRRAVDGRVIGLLEAAAELYFGDAPSVQERAAARLLDEVLIARGQAPLTRDASGRATNLLEAALELDLDDSTPHLRRLAANAGGRAQSVALVNAALVARGMAPLKRGVDGRATGLVEAAVAVELDDRTPYLRHLTTQAGGVVHSMRLVEQALAARGLPALTRDAYGRALNLLEAALLVDLDDSTPYLRRLAATAGGLAHSVRLVNEALAARGLPALPRNAGGHVVGLLAAAVQLELDDVTPHLRRMATRVAGLSR